MSARTLHLLLVEDSENDAELVVRDIRRSGYKVTYERVQTAAGMKAALETGGWDAVVSDYSMPTFSAPDALALLKSSGYDLPFIIVSGTIGEEIAVSALKAGAHDFLVKGRLARLVPALERELREVVSRRERSRAEEALRQSEARFRSLVEHAVFGIYQSTADGRFLAVNPALVSMLHYGSAAELIAVDLGALCPDDEVREDLLHRVHGLEQFSGEEAMLRCKTGETIRVRLAGRVVAAPSDTRPTVLEVLVEDITETERLEGQLRQAQKMEGIGRLAGGIAHDFNNMLTAIIGYSELVLEQVDSETPIGKDLIEIRTAADRAAGLTRQLLAFSRRQVLRIGDVDVNEVAKSMQALLERLIGEDITIDLELADGLRPISADRTQLEQVIMNIATNARDAMPRGGRLRIATAGAAQQSVVAATGLPLSPGRYIALTMSDTGSGMDAKTREHIFEPFFTTKEVGKGTGLGLATVYGIVKQLGGYIWVSSEVGAGTSFAMYFPESDKAAGKPATEGERPQAAPSGSRDEVVLVVEDEAGLRKLVVRTLSRRGYTVLDAGTPSEGLALAAEHRGSITLVVTDVVMPVMHGPELAGILRETQPDLKVLYISGYAGGEITREDGLEANAVLLGKPFTAYELLSAVRDLLDEP